MDFPEPKWAIPDILPEGLSILAGKPKQGKSVLALNICVAVALGDKALGEIDVEKGSAIYLALEDTERRLQIRLKKMMPRGPAWVETNNLIISRHWPRMGEGGIKYLEDEMKKYSDLRLVVIDPLANFTPLKGSKNNLYQQDYAIIGRIKELADNHGVAILIIHHQRKMDADDPFDTFSGTLGLTGAADELLAFIWKNGQRQLHIIGRDVDAAEYVLQGDKDRYQWTLLGKVDEIQSSKIKQAVFDVLKETGETLGPKELTEKTGEKYNKVKDALGDLVSEGKIERPERGKYRYVEGS